jgi:hypothetical protein
VYISELGGWYTHADLNSQEFTGWQYDEIFLNDKKLPGCKDVWNMWCKWKSGYIETDYTDISRVLTMLYISLGDVHESWFRFPIKAVIIQGHEIRFRIIFKE